MIKMNEMYGFLLVVMSAEEKTSLFIYVFCAQKLVKSQFRYSSDLQGNSP